MNGENSASDAPDWAYRAKHIKGRPEWQDFIPDELHQLGEVFFPIPRGEKGYNYPHHLQAYRFSADSQVLNAYFEQGWGYGISCAGDIAVVDVDDLDFLDDITEKLPKSLWQKSGSREGVHIFYFVEGLETRQNLYANFMDPRISPEQVKEESDWIHIGEVKCDPHGYVVGTNSVHPSGNRYGPLHGDEIATITKEELMEAIEDFKKPDTEATTQYDPSNYSDKGDSSPKQKHPFYQLTADDVLPHLQAGKRVAHPVHGSDTGMNFIKNSDGETFTCWRCQYGGGSGCGLNGPQYLACEATGMDCEDVRRKWYKDSSLHYDAWMLAVEKGLVGTKQVPYKVLHGFAVKTGVIKLSDKIGGRLYHDIEQQVKYEAEIGILFKR